MINLGNKLKQLRIEKKLTQKQLADILGVAISAISSYESGTRYPSYETLISMAHLYHVSTDYLLGLDNSKTITVKDLDDNELKAVWNFIDLIRSQKKTS